MKIPLSRPDIGELEVEYVTKALRSGSLSLGPKVTEFEGKFAEYVGARYAIAVNSGTSALHLCVKALGIGPEDEAITTSFSFVASANCLLYERALPVFADIDSETLNIDPETIREVITVEYVRDRAKGSLVHRDSGRTLKAILPVHIFGLPCDMTAILEIADEFNLYVLEDACEALGSRYRGQHVGTFGDAAAFGFYPNKLMTTAEGGMVVTNDERIAANCLSLRNQGRDGQAGWLRHIALGFNYRLSDLQCALGLAQLERIEELISSRERVAREYSRALSNLPGLILPRKFSDRSRSWFAYVVQLAGPLAVRERERLMEGLRSQDISCQSYFPPIHRQPYFQDIKLSRPPSLPQTDSAAERCVALPFFPTMTSEQILEVSATVRDLLSEERASAETKLKNLSAAAVSGL
jgi:perosamine synthetase